MSSELSTSIASSKFLATSHATPKSSSISSSAAETSSQVFLTFSSSSPSAACSSDASSPSVASSAAETSTRVFLKDCVVSGK